MSSQLAALTESVQAPCHQTVNFTFNLLEVTQDTVTVELRIKQGTRAWIGHDESYSTAKIKAIVKAISEVHEFNDESSLRLFLGMAPRRRNHLVDAVRAQLRPIRKLGKNGGHGFGPALGDLYNALDKLEVSLINQGHFVQ